MAPICAASPMKMAVFFSIQSRYCASVKARRLTRPNCRISPEAISRMHRERLAMTRASPHSVTSVRAVPKRKSPARTAMRSPQRALIVSCPRLVAERSTMSSWTRVAI